MFKQSSTTTHSVYQSIKSRNSISLLLNKLILLLLAISPMLSVKDFVNTIIGYKIPKNQTQKKYLRIIQIKNSHIQYIHTYNTYNTCNAHNTCNTYSTYNTYNTDPQLSGSVYT